MAERLKAITVRVTEAAHAEDITERKRAEEARRESEARYRELFEQSPVSIWEEDWSAVKKMIDGLASSTRTLATPSSIRDK